MTEWLVQYGCGLSAPDGWINFDASPTLRLQRLPFVGPFLMRGRSHFPASVRYGDVVRGLPMGDGSCAAVYCSHVLEHLSLADLRTALRETRRILTDGGQFRGVMPDLETLARAYVSDTGPRAAIEFMEKSLLGIRERPRGLAGIAASAFGNSHHLWMWDYKALAAELASAGFKDIRRAQMGDSASRAFADVEDKIRWNGCLGFECRR
jgi:hypothetical protein